MRPLADLQRAFFDGLYTNRIPVAIASIVVVVVGLVRRVAARAGSRRRGDTRAGRASSLVVVLAVGLPLTWYSRLADLDPDPVDRAGPGRRGRSHASRPLTVVASLERRRGGRRPVAPPATPAPTSFARRARSRPAMFHGTDDFHFGRGTATIVETAPGRYTLRLADFSVRNGPDLYVYLSPDANDYADGALELGKLKATDGAFGYDLPPAPTPPISPARSSGASSSRTSSRSRRLPPPDARRRRKSGIGKRGGSAYLTAVNATDGSVARPVARRKLGLLSRLTRENPTGSRRLPRGVWFSCTTTRT